MIEISELVAKHNEAQNKVNFMYKFNNMEMKMDSQSILSRAPKLIINNIDSVNQILPQEKIYINAFGVVDGVNNLNTVPKELEKALEVLQSNQIFLEDMGGQGQSELIAI